MPDEVISVTVQMDGPTFRKFAVFDTFRLRRRWISPVVFALILIAFSVACFLLRDRDQSILLGCVLMAVGLGLPAVYFGMFHASLRKQASSLRLNPPRTVYALTLSRAADGVLIRNTTKAEEELTLSWASLYGAYRVPGCIYLYAAPAKAFLLPDGQASVSPDALWAFLSEQLGDERLHDMR